jgi:hypothetical protein
MKYLIYALIFLCIALLTVCLWCNDLDKRQKALNDRLTKLENIQLDGRTR